MIIHRVLLSPPIRGMSLVVHGEWNKGHDPCPLYLRGQLLLVVRTGACDASRQDLASFSDKVLKHMRCLVVYGQCLLFTEPACLPLIIWLFAA